MSNISSLTSLKVTLSELLICIMCKMSYENDTHIKTTILVRGLKFDYLVEILECEGVEVSLVVDVHNFKEEFH